MQGKFILKDMVEDLAHSSKLFMGLDRRITYILAWALVEFGVGVFIVYIAGSKVCRIDPTSGTALPSFPEVWKVLVTI